MNPDYLSCDLVDEKGKVAIRVRVAIEALEDYPAHHNIPPDTPEAILKRIKRDVQFKAQSMFRRGDVEPDGSVMVRSKDLNP